MKSKVELLAPAGDMEKLKTAIYFGADAVYFAGKNYGLRAFGNNFELEQIKEAVDFVHSHNKKCYVTLNVYARDKDFAGLCDYVKYLEKIGVDAVIVSDMGVFNFVKHNAPKLAIHISTQANTTNKYAVEAYKNMGAERIVLARELTFEEIQKIREYDKTTELEMFVHGAMCISYSGRCLLSNYMTGRDSNHGECAQACRWRYKLVEDTRPNEEFGMMEDELGTYIFNSKDMNLIEHLDKLIDVGVSSFKIEGRMKSPYYVATVVNAYRRVIDNYYNNGCKNYTVPDEIKQELLKASHRKYTTGFTFNDGEVKQNYESAAQEQESKFMAIVLSGVQGRAVVEQRNKFSIGDELEILSPSDTFNKKIKITKIVNSKGLEVESAKLVQERVELFFDEDVILNSGDILRM